MKTLNAAVIGCGVIGPTHAASFNQVENVSLKTVCDLQEDRAQKLASVYAARAVTDYREVLADPDIDLVSIAVPHPQHPDLFMEAIAAGKAVICEKPLGVSHEQLQAMVAAAAQAKVPSAGVFQHRFSFTVRHLKKLLDQGAFGRIESASLWFRCMRGEKYYKADAWRGTIAGEGGGVFINQAIHFIDLITFLLGAPLSISGNVEHRWVPDIEVEDAGQATVIYPNHVSVSLDVANVPDIDWDSRLEIRGEKGRVVVNAEHQILETSGLNEANVAELKRLEAEESAQNDLPGKACYGTLHAVQFADFANAFRTGRRPHVSIADAAQTNRLILALYESSRTGTPIAIHDEQGNPVKPS
jgi:predicted dehydrogenase